MPSEGRIHLQIYGIRNCDTVRATLKWLETRNVPHTFHDFRKDGLDEALLTSWVSSAHGPYLVNKRSATWRKLSDEDKLAMKTDPVPVLLANPTLIKRPVVTDGETLLDIGFAPDNLEDYI